MKSEEDKGPVEWHNEIGVGANDDHVNQDRHTKDDEEVLLVLQYAIEDKARRDDQHGKDAVGDQVLGTNGYCDYTS